MTIDINLLNKLNLLADSCRNINIEEMKCRIRKLRSLKELEIKFKTGDLVKSEDLVNLARDLKQLNNDEQPLVYESIFYTLGRCAESLSRLVDKYFLDSICADLKFILLKVELTLMRIINQQLIKND